MFEICPQCHSVQQPGQSHFAMNEQLLFCSKQCLTDYLQHFSDFFNTVEVSIRSRLGLLEETSVDILSHLELCEEVLENPLESTTIIDCREHLYYAQYGQVKYKASETYILIIYTVVQDENIFLFAGASSDLRFAQAFLFEIDAENYSSDSLNDEGLSFDFGMSEKDFFILLDQKKSVLLAQLMENLTPDDFSFSDYIEYIDDGKEVLKMPDELFKWEDDDGDSMLTYSKIMQRDSKAYYYVLIGITIESNIFPVLMFPTKDQKILNLFQRGERQIGQTAN